MFEGTDQQDYLVEEGRVEHQNGNWGKTFSRAKKGYSIRKRLGPNVKYCRKLGQGISTGSHWNWHDRGSQSRGGSQIVKKYSQEIVAENLDKLETFDSFDAEKRLEKWAWCQEQLVKAKGRQ